jgi:hypothetical protein
VVNVTISRAGAARCDVDHHGGGRCHNEPGTTARCDVDHHTLTRCRSPASQTLGHLVVLAHLDGDALVPVGRPLLDAGDADLRGDRPRPALVALVAVADPRRAARVAFADEVNPVDPAGPPDGVRPRALGSGGGGREPPVELVADPALEATNVAVEVPLDAPDLGVELESSSSPNARSIA